jgi:hypothetical protein
MSQFPRRGTSMFGTTAKGIIPVFGPQGLQGSSGKDGATNQSVDYIGLIAILIKEIQDLKAILKKNKIE